MDVVINPDPKWSKVDHLFVLLAENDRPAGADKRIVKAISDSGFVGRADESITVLSDAPRKLTLMGLGKRESLTIRGLRAALYSIGKTAKKARDRSIAVRLPYAIG